MAPLRDHSSLRKVLLFYLLLSLFFFTSSFLLLVVSSNTVEEVSEEEVQNKFSSDDVFGSRRISRRTLMVHQLENENEDSNSNFLSPPATKKKKLVINQSLSLKNKTKLAKSNNGFSSSKNQTKAASKTTDSFKNQTKIIKLPSDSLKNKTKIKPTSNEKPTIKSQFKKLNSTSKSSSFPKNNNTLLTKKSSDLLSKNKTSKETKIPDVVSASKSKSKTNEGDKDKDQSPIKKNKQIKGANLIQPNWLDQEQNNDEEEEDLVSGFRDLPTKFQESLFPDLERISKTSQVYINKANKQITKGFKPIVGNKYASTIASIISCAFILIPLLLVSLIINRIKAYFSLQKILIFIQIYLSIYFSILCLSALTTGLEPLRFFYATSQSTYVGLQVLQTLAYVLYLLLLLMYLILVFSTETGIVTKFLGLGQTFVGFIIGLHYYMMVFHRAVLHQPPKTSWKVHGIYATCFLAISLLTRADRRKKGYFGDGGDEEGKLS